MTILGWTLFGLMAACGFVGWCFIRVGTRSDEIDNELSAALEGDLTVYVAEREGRQMSTVALYHRTSLRVIDLFKFGLDTAEIADRLGISEAEALKELTIQRSQKRGLDIPYIMASMPSAASAYGRTAER